MSTNRQEFKNIVHRNFNIKLKYKKAVINQNADNKEYPS